MSRVCVALSGGVDSLAALLLLREKHEVVALRATFTAPRPGRDPDAALAAICQSLGVEFHTADLREEFSRLVSSPFVEAWRNGLSPNPCAICNRLLKFGALMDAASDLGADFFATGHYANRVKNSRGAGAPFLLGRARDSRKDQSYFLAHIDPERLEKIIFPLANYLKSEVRLEVAKRGFKSPEAEESLDICFIPDGNRTRFLREASRERGRAPLAPGPIFLRTENGLKLAGYHSGLWNYTEGQRKGLGLAWKRPLYVIGRDAATNALIVGEKNLALVTETNVGDLNFWVPPESWPAALLVKTRSVGAPIPAAVDAENDGAKIRFFTPQLPAGPGQLAVIMDENGVVLASGIIRRPD